jgi:hypothetical protein
MYFAKNPNNASMIYEIIKSNVHNYGSFIAPLCVTLDPTLYNQNSIINDMLDQKFEAYQSANF